MSETLVLKVVKALDAVDSFSTLLEHETDALKKSDYSMFEALQDEKITRAQHYQQAVLSFEEDIDILKTMDDGLKDKLRAAHSRFAIAADANEQILLTTKNVSERIVKLIMNAARRTVSEGPNYGAKGIQSLSDKIPVHFKVNEVFKPRSTLPADIAANLILAAILFWRILKE